MDTQDEFSKICAKLATWSRDCSLRDFGVIASRPLSEWQEKGWIYTDSPPRLVPMVLPLLRESPLSARKPTADQALEAFQRHIAQVRMNCAPDNFSCRPRRRQALLQWAYTLNA
jgi:hypothetical protein